MGLSYVIVTLLMALALEGLLLTAAFFVFTRSPFLAYLATQRANQTSQIYALQAAVQAAGAGELNPNTTFEPGQSAALSLKQANDPLQAEFSYLHLNVPYVEPGTSAPDRPTFALLIGPGEQVIASSYPDRYPVSTNLERALPGEMALIRHALSGTSDGAVKDTPQGMQASVARTIWSRDQKPLGAVYIQVPAAGPPDTNLPASVGGVLIPSSVGWLCLMLPIGLLFGILTTRGTIRRIERLAEATARFTDGDYAQRVPISRQDEIGQLELQFNEMAGQLVNSFAQRQALAEESVRREERARIEQEMSSAHYVQQSLLPEEIPAIEGWQIEPFYCPARQVGGDLYDFLHLPDGRIGIVIGDVSGKGMSAALIMATTCAMIRAAAPTVSSPGQVLALVNNLMQGHISPRMFVTCFYGILDPASGRMCFANAGHDIPYLSRGGEIVELRAAGMPLGLLPEQIYPEQEVLIDKHDALLFYTDGLVEAHNAERAMFGFSRLQYLIKDGAHKDGLIKFLLNELQAFTGTDWEQEDDITLVMLRKMA
jgi:serine phosphatase RsbU (regulator of sigma subunit)/type II secretory pathway pseudopilin PulG